MPVSNVAELERTELHVSWGAATDTGKLRPINEDSYLATAGLWAVADGMGGHESGDVASRITIEACSAAALTTPLSLDLVAETIAESNDRVRAEATRSGQIGMGTTVVGVALIDNGGDDALVVFNVGDSRCYVLSDSGECSQLTTDHSHVQELVELGEITNDEARSHPDRNVVTRAIGIDSTVAADFYVLPRDVGSRLLLCSDGVSDQLNEGEIGALLVAAESPAEAAAELIEAVLGGPARDNATAVVLDIRWDTPPVGNGSLGDAEVTGPRPTPAVDEKKKPSTADSDVHLIADVPIAESDGAKSAAEHVGPKSSQTVFIDGVPQ